jgi:hypothetical protein
MIARNLIRIIIFVCGTLAISTFANATEGGGSIYPTGAEAYSCCAVPPPGLFGIVYSEYNEGSSFRDNNGNAIPIPGFKVTSAAIVPRLIWVTHEQILGASLVFHGLLPLVNLDVKEAGSSQSKTGVGDASFGTALGWHLSPQLHTVAGLDVFAPTGSYNKNDLANIGRNYWAFQPLIGVSYIDPRGFNGDLKVMYNINTINPATSYTSGHELIMDYDTGYGIGHGWVVGIGGYFYQQLTNDKQNGQTILNNKGRALAIGPSIKYGSEKGWFVTLKYELDTEVRNRVQGKALWLKAVFPLG